MQQGENFVIFGGLYTIQKIICPWYFEMYCSTVLYIAATIETFQWLLARQFSEAAAATSDPSQCSQEN